MSAARLGVVALALSAGLAGCDGRGNGERGIDRETFVAAYTDLRLAIFDDVFDEATRDSILASHDVTEDELRAFVDRHADDPDALAEAWREVMDSLAAYDAARADSIADDTIMTDPAGRDSFSEAPAAADSPDR